MLFSRFTLDASATAPNPAPSFRRTTSMGLDIPDEFFPKRPSNPNLANILDPKPFVPCSHRPKLRSILTTFFAFSSSFVFLSCSFSTMSFRACSLLVSSGSVPIDFNSSAKASTTGGGADGGGGLVVDDEDDEDEDEDDEDDEATAAAAAAPSAMESAVVPSPKVILGFGFLVFA